MNKHLKHKYNYKNITPVKITFEHIDYIRELPYHALLLKKPVRSTHLERASELPLVFVGW